MKFNFKIQDYQTEAVNSVVEVFNGQPNLDVTTYIRDIGEKQISEEEKNGQIGLDLEDQYDTTGYKNASIKLTKDNLLDNIKKIQSKNNIQESSKLEGSLGMCTLDVEMETGTGKTYVYIKTMFELNRRYGWSKFIVVVPSVAIREGVKKTFEITEEHFMEYYGKKIRYFIYDGDNLTKIDEFSSDAGINVMIINMQAFARDMKEGAKNKASLKIYGERDEFGSRRPIDAIAANQPILILDEPQKMGGKITKSSMNNFNPLFSINYSATHKEQHNLVYVLDAVDAYNKSLVKKIEVKGFELQNLRGTDKYLYLEEIKLSPNKPPQAKLEFEINYKNSINRESRIVNVGDDLYHLSNEMKQYEGFTIADINAQGGYVEFLNGDRIETGNVSGDVSEIQMKRVQMRETIRSHFEKERELFNRDIKSLSLFFIDEVAKYRQYDEDGNEILGEYGQIFEEEYNNILSEYRSFDDLEYMVYLDNIEASSTHTGYFSIDKKGHMINSKEKKSENGSDDISAYDLILKNKERLLSFDEPVRFIFSHSALREGWDNPNVFQICTLKNSDSTTQKRQEVGRGMRLAVDQQGNRMDKERCGDDVHNINKLTVIASDSYKTFVKELQEDLKKDLYNRPQKADKEFFENKKVFVGDKEYKIDAHQANAIYKYLIKNDYVRDDDDTISEKYRSDLKDGICPPLPESVQHISEAVHNLIQSVYDESVFADMFVDGHKTKVTENKLNDNFYKDEFKKLWDTINHKYAYRVDFDSAELIRNAIRHIDNHLLIGKMKYTMTTGEQQKKFTAAAVREHKSFEVKETKRDEIKTDLNSQIKYDLVGDVAKGTSLTRRTVVKILKGIDERTLKMFAYNPEEFIKKMINLINEQKSTMIVEHIKYNQIEGEYDTDIFMMENKDYSKAILTKKHIQDYLFVDGVSEESVEKRMAHDLESADEVVAYAKLPRGFKIPTPVGEYSPDWAIAFKEGKVKHIYFVAETKGSMESMQLRPVEQAKINCAKKLFSQLSNDMVKFDHVDSYETLWNMVSN